MNDSVELYARIINEKHKDLVKLANTLLRTLPTDEPNDKMTVARRTLEASTDILNIISKQDVPTWLNQLIDYLNNYINDRWKAPDFLIHFLNIKNQMESHIWISLNNGEIAFDFDEIFERFKKESRLPALFSQIIKLLNDIKDSGEIDSITMIKSLGKVISTINKGNEGSYFSLEGAWNFLIIFIKNYMVEELAKIPALGSLMTSLFKTIEEARDEMNKVQNQINEEIRRVVEIEIKPLSSKPDLAFIGYNQNAQLSPGLSISLPQLPAITA